MANSMTADAHKATTWSIVLSVLMIVAGLLAIVVPLVAGVAVALRFVPYHHHHPSYYRLGWSVVMGVIGLLALAASVYLVYVLEILKFRHRRAGEMRSVDPDTTEHQIDESVRHDLETGEFERVGSSDGAEAEPRGAGSVHDARRLDDSRARGAGVDGGAQPEPRRGERAAGRRDR